MHVTTNVVEDASRRNANHRQATAAPLDSRSSLRGCATLAWACIVEDVVCQARPSESAAAGNSCDLVGTVMMTMAMQTWRLEKTVLHPQQFGEPHSSLCPVRRLDEAGGRTVSLPRGGVCSPGNRDGLSASHCVRLSRSRPKPRFRLRFCVCFPLLPACQAASRVSSAASTPLYSSLHPLHSPPHAALTRIGT
jgi:hypothetical protein